MKNFWAFLISCLSNERGEVSVGGDGGAGAGGAGGGAGGGSGAPAAITAESLGALQGDSFRAVMPKEIAEKPYMKDVNTFGDFVKKFDGAQTLLGQRTTPDDKATPEQWKEFHSKTAPKSAEEYKLPQTVEGLDPEFVKKAGEAKWIKPLFHAAQISPHQANILYPEFLKMIKAADAAEGKAADERFAKLSSETFKDQKDVVVTNAKKFMATHIPAEMQPMLDSLDEKQLTLLIAMTDGMAKKFTGEDPFRGGGAGAGSGGGETKDALIAQMQAIQKDPVYTDPFKDRPKHAELLAKMDVIRGKLKKIQGG
jgi:hypothetical protein